ncbi:hypothetical protein J4Q44_G00292820, partial [Coregonus suidteri]
QQSGEDVFFSSSLAGGYTNNAQHRAAAASPTWWSLLAPLTWSSRSQAASGTAVLLPTKLTSSQPMPTS